ncbi:MAG: hypothetical protein AAF607_00290 [Pseudomonadota bacterium]
MSWLEKTLEVDCTVEVQNTFESLHAHVRFDGGVTVNPGDEVTVHGKPIEVPYGDKQTFRRKATVKRAGLVERLWTKATGDFEFMELCEFSFSEERL